MKYDEPKIEIVEQENQDVITTSTLSKGTNTDMGDWPF